MDWDQAIKHPNYDQESMRILLPDSFIETMPFKEVTLDELYQLRMEADYNPLQYYPEVKKRDGEVGYDQQNRYILKGENDVQSE